MQNAQRRPATNEFRRRPPFQTQNQQQSTHVRKPTGLLNELRSASRFAQQVPAKPPIAAVRKQVKKPLSKPTFGQAKGKGKTQFYTPPVQLGHTLLGKIESEEDVAIDYERSRSIAAVRRSREKQRRPIPLDKVVREIVIFSNMPVSVLAHSMAVSIDHVLAKLRQINPSATKEDRLELDLSALLVEEFGHKHKKKIEILDTIHKESGDTEEYIFRAPIVTVVGHVDHGKTSLLDALRATQYTESESGGITQSIGASQVFAPDGRFITFIDTPGHEIFTAMRARGVSLTDIVLLIIAADDGIKEQTIESIQHAKASKANIIVVFTKADKPSTDIEKIKQMLMRYEILVESLGGDVPDIAVSAKTKYNLDALIELILLQAELMELKGNPKPKASGVVLEAYLDKNCGPVTTVIIKNGTLRKGDAFLSGSVHGKVRSMVDWRGKQVDQAGPSMPVQIMGFSKAPVAGDDFIVMDEEDAKEAALKRKEISSVSTFSIHKSEMTYTIEDIWRALTGDYGITKLSFIIKADSSGSAEAIADAISRISYENVEISIIMKGIGGVTEGDILLAKASEATIIAFKVDVKPNVAKDAEVWNVKIQRYDIIYQILDYINGIITAALAPKEEVVSIGRAEIREVFVKPKIGAIAGCFVQDGIIKRDTKAVLIRNGSQIYSGNIASIKQLRDDKREVKAGQVCGLTLHKFSDYKVGDIIECFETRAIV